jgi:hypothetical protein
MASSLGSVAEALQPTDVGSIHLGLTATPSASDALPGPTCPLREAKLTTPRKPNFVVLPCHGGSSLTVL